MATQFSAAERGFDPHAQAARLYGGPVTSVSLVPRSGNNRVYRVETPAGRFALKYYAADEGVPRRLACEYEALRFLSANGAAHCVPRALAADLEAGFALYEWIDGTPVGDQSMTDIAAAVAFIAAAAAARYAPGASTMPLAAEACLSADSLVENISTRIARLRAAAPQDEQLDRFLSAELEPAFAQRAVALRRYAQRNQTGPDGVLASAQRTLSPSDFSFHNCLRRADGTLVFLDFEYFGWDDPVKLCADFVWHPAMQLRCEERDAFVRGMRALFASADSAFAQRLDAFFPCFGLKWCLIMLNEFLPTGWGRRRFSGEQRSLADVKTAQLHKARTLLAEVCEGTRTWSR